MGDPDGQGIASAVGLLSDARVVGSRDRGLERLTSLYSGERPASPMVLYGVTFPVRETAHTEPREWVARALEEASRHVTDTDMRDDGVFRPLAVEFGPRGVHFVDALLGARTFRWHGQWWSRSLSTPVGALEMPRLDADETWRGARLVASAFVEHGATGVLFGSPTLSSALNVAVNLYGERFLVALAADPDAANRDLATINALLRDLHRWYREHVPRMQLQGVVAGSRCQPPGFGQLCGCSTQLLSARMYRESVAPLDADLLRDYPGGGMIHLCGDHTQHIPVWREMPTLRAVQLNDQAADDFEEYYRRLREDQILYLNPTPSMTAARGASITGGRRLVVVADALDS